MDILSSQEDTPREALVEEQAKRDDAGACRSRSDWSVRDAVRTEEVGRLLTLKDIHICHPVPEYDGNIRDLAHAAALGGDLYFDGRSLGRHCLSSHRKNRALSGIERGGEGSSVRTSACFPAFHPVAAR